MPIFEHSPGSDFNGDDRIIPDIPGVRYSESSLESAGTLFEVPDEESSEDALEEIEREIRHLLNVYGVEGINQVPKETIIELWGEMEMSPHLVADLVLYATSEVQQLNRDELAKPNFQDLIERRRIFNNPYDFRSKLVETVAPNLVRLGYSNLDAYRLPRSRDEDLALAFRVEGWLLGQFFMEGLPEQIKVAVRAAPERKIDRSEVFILTRNEIVRQARIIDSRETQQMYDPRITSNAKAYRELQKTVRNAYRIADTAFAKFVHN